MLLQQMTAATTVIVNAAGNIDTATQYVVSKNGGVFAPGTGTFTALGGGAWQIALSSGDTNAVGQLVVLALNVSNGVVEIAYHQVVSFDPSGPNYGGGGTDPWLTALPGAYVAGEAGFILGTNLDALVSGRAVPGDKMDLVDAPNAVAGAALANDLLALANGIETGITPKQAIRAIAAVLAGLLTISGTTVTIKGLGVATTRLTATTDSQGQRTVVTLNL